MKRFCVLALLILALAVGACCADSNPKPSFRIDLKQFGFIDDRGPAEFSTLGFLSDDLLLVIINQRVFHGVDPLDTDQPPATVVVFDLKQRKLSQRASIAVVKAANSVALLTNEKFAVVSASDVRLYSAALRREKSVPLRAQLDARDSLKLLPGGDDLVVRDGNASADGRRSISSELRHTTGNKIMHPLNIDEESPPNFRQVSVVDNQSAKTLLSLHWNPKTHLVPDALSPNGTKLAVVRNGMLEVYEIP